MAELKKAVNKMEEQGIPRAVLSEGILTIDVDSHVETMEEQEDARWHQLLNAHRTKKILTGQLGGIEKLDSGWTVVIQRRFKALRNFLKQRNGGKRNLK